MKCLEFPICRGANRQSAFRLWYLRQLPSLGFLALLFLGLGGLFRFAPIFAGFLAGGSLRWSSRASPAGEHCFGQTPELNNTRPHASVQDSLSQFLERQSALFETGIKERAGLAATDFACVLAFSILSLPFRLMWWIVVI